LSGIGTTPLSSTRRKQKCRHRAQAPLGTIAGTIRIHAPGRPRSEACKYARTEQKHLDGKEICLIFEKTSTRTRCAFEVACYDQGAHVAYLDPTGSQIGHKESFKDTARVLGRMYDTIEYRGSAQKGVETLGHRA
jgi:ornithine carbamoyltransferase